MISFDTAPERYRHWKLTVEPPVATLTLDVDEDGGLSGDYQLELNSYDLSVDIELYDAIQRLRFEHPEVGVVVVTGGKDAEVVRKRALAAATARGPESEGIELTPLQREEFDAGFCYPNLRVELDEEEGTATLTLVAPASLDCFAPEPGPNRLRSAWWPLAACRELDDALILLRTNWRELGTIVLRTEGDPLAIAAADVAFLSAREDDWFVREVVLYWKRTLERLERSSRSVIALVEPGSCYVGTLFELALAADRAYMLDGDDPDRPDVPPAQVVLTGMNFGPLPRGNGLTRLQNRFLGGDDHVEALAKRVGDSIEGAEAAELDLVAEGVGP